MKSLTDLIQEKLKIGSKSKVDVNDNIGLFNEISYVLNINDKNPLQYPKDKLDFIKDEIKYWILKNHITNVKYYADDNTLEVYKAYYVKDHKDILSYFDKNYDEKLINKEYTQSHHLYSNYCCELRYTQNAFIVYIQEPTNRTTLTFYIIKANEED